VNKRFIARALLSFIFFLFVLYFAIAWYFSSMIIIAERDAEKIQLIKNKNRQNPPNLRVIEATDLHPQIWHFKRSKKMNCAIIFTHGWGNARTSMNKFKKAFETTSCDFISYDLRGHGINPITHSTGGIRERQDLIDIHTYLRNSYQLTDQQIGWFGLSLGASITLQAAALDVQPAFVVSDSPFQDWETAIFERGVEMYGHWVKNFKLGLTALIYIRTGVIFTQASAINSAHRIQSPVLLIHSQADEETGSHQSAAIFERLQVDRSQFVHTDWGSQHGKDIDTNPKLYSSLITEFLLTYAPSFVVSEPKNN